MPDKPLAAEEERGILLFEMVQAQERGLAWRGRLIAGARQHLVRRRLEGDGAFTPRESFEERAGLVRRLCAELFEQRLAAAPIDGGHAGAIATFGVCDH